MLRPALALSVAALLTGCMKSVVQPIGDAAGPLPPHSGPVCLLKSPLPQGVEFVYLGRAVANQQWYGSHSEVNKALADEARGVGADAVVEMVSKYKPGPIAWARPQSHGNAVRITSEGFDCVAAGGELNYGRLHPVAAPASSPTTPYDACISSAIKVSDPTLRVEAMAACEGA